MSRNIVFEGWLTKSPPNKRIWRTKWRRRWFALRQSGDLPGQYFLDYYADRNCRRLKGTINLDLCEQVDAGLHMERAGNGSLDPKLRGSVFTIQTQTRTYHLEAECEDEMEKWVDAICRVCGLRPTDDIEDNQTTIVAELRRSQVTTTATGTDEHYECFDSAGPYIPISECITGVRAQDEKRTFSFDAGSVMASAQKTTCDKATETRDHVYNNQPQIKINNVDLSENESNISDEDCKYLNASQTNIPHWSVTRSFTKLAVTTDKSPKNCGSEEGPPVPPRPPKTLTRECIVEINANYPGPGTQRLRVPRRMSTSPHSPGRVLTLPPNNNKLPDDEEDISTGHQSLQYCNLPSLPPAVDRALKPRYSNQSIFNTFAPGQSNADESKPDTLQYLDLDLPSSPPPTGTTRKRNVNITHGKSMSAVEADCVYKTVDFLKTEAFNITRQDAEASRSIQY